MKKAIKFVLFFISLLVVLSAAQGAIATGPSTVDSHEETEEINRGNWYIHYDIDVAEDGVAEVTATIKGDDFPSTVFPSVGRTKNAEIIDGQNALTLQESTDEYEWNVSKSQTVRYSVQLGHLDRPVSTGVFDKSVVFAAGELMPVRRWYADELPAAHQFTIDAPAGWEIASPGENINGDTYELNPYADQSTWPRTVFAVGDFNVTTVEAGGETIRLAELPSADGPAQADVASLFESILPVYEDTYGADDVPRMALVVPQNHESGGIAQGPSLQVSDEEPVFDTDTSRSTYAHELTHTYQQYYSGEGGMAEASASYLQTWTLYEAGVISEDEYKQMLRTYITTPRNEIGSPVESTVAGSEYFKGAAFFAALDLDIRAQTDGDKALGDVLKQVHDQRGTDYPFDVSREEWIRALNNTTGEDYTAFYETYADSTAFPMELLSDEYSLTSPIPVDHSGPANAEINASTTTASVGEEITFNASDSTGGANIEIVAYQWELGTGSEAIGETTTYGYEREGEFTVTMTIITDNGVKHQTTTDVEITGNGDDDDNAVHDSLFTNDDGIVNTEGLRLAIEYWRSGEVVP